MVLEISGSWFRSAYYLYVIEVKQDDDQFFYVGQTGDNKYITARPPFRRLAAHVEVQGTSRQNQVWRYIAIEKLGHRNAQAKAPFSDNTKQAVEDYLAGATVRMSVYRAEPFRPGSIHDVHLEVVRRVRALEKHVISSFLIAGYRIMNKKTVRPYTVAGSCPYPEILEKIKADFRLDSVTRKN